ncbi:MAG: SDR family NAD(P)-dependent oxidoreductase, partial [Eubacteriales bacterium]|nr:SDR family NAD(P)-dependent oxidoreductase [Eubacteriales bacterium]
MDQFIQFKNQVCLVTGAGSENGIGFSTAKILGRLEGRIALISTTDRIQRRVDELRTLGAEARGYVADLMDRAQVEKVIDEIISDFGHIDVLINNAGMTQVGEAEDFTEFSQLSYDDWDLSISRNLTLCFNVTRKVLPYMISAEYGRIVNVS